MTDMSQAVSVATAPAVSPLSDALARGAQALLLFLTLGALVVGLVTSVGLLMNWPALVWEGLDAVGLLLLAGFVGRLAWEARTQ